MKAEQSIEKYLCRKVKEAGGMAIKLVPNPAGIPDRLIVSNGKCYFVELKTDGGHVEPIQLAMHRRLHKLNQKVFILWSYEDVNWFMSEVLKNEDFRKC